MKIKYNLKSQKSRIDIALNIAPSELILDPVPISPTRLACDPFSGFGSGVAMTWTLVTSV
jgi:hypothetical protein